MLPCGQHLCTACLDDLRKQEVVPHDRVLAVLEEARGAERRLPGQPAHRAPHGQEARRRLQKQERRQAQRVPRPPPVLGRQPRPLVQRQVQAHGARLLRLCPRRTRSDRRCDCRPPFGSDATR